MFESILMFVLGFTCVTSVYEISKTNRNSKSDRVKKSAEKLVSKK